MSRHVPSALVVALLGVALATMQAADPLPIKLTPKKSGDVKGLEADPVLVQGEAASKQEALRRQFDDFKQSLLRLAQRLESSSKPEDREKSATLKKAIALASEQGVDTKFTTLMNALKTSDTFKNLEQLQVVMEKNEDLRKDLRNLIELLLTDDRDAELRRRREEYARLLEKLKEIIPPQERIRDQTGLGRKDAKDLKKEQDIITKKTRDLVTPKEDQDGKGKGDARADAKTGKGNGEAKDDAKDPKGDPRAKEGKDENKDGKGDAKDGKSEGKEGKGEGKDGKGDNKDGKPGDGKEAKGGGKEGKGDGKEGKGDNKDGKPAAPKESKPGEGKQNELADAKARKPNDGKPGDGKPGDPKAGKPNDGKSGDGKEGKPSDGKGSDSKAKSEGKSDAKGGSDSKSAKGSESKPSDSKGGQPGQPGQQGQQGQSKGDQQPGGQPPPPPPPGDQPEQAQVKKQIQDANQDQKKAGENLGKNNREKAGDNQDEAIRKLLEAKKKLEDLLRQLREEEIERLLAALQQRCERMLAMQIVVRDGTVALDKVILGNSDKKPTRADEQQSNVLSDKEEEIVRECSKAFELVKAEGSAVAFAEVFYQVRGDMATVAGRLRKTDVGVVTVTIEKDIIQTLEEMIDALKKARQDNQKPKTPPMPGQGGGQPPDQRLIDMLAELKMIRSMQKRVNDRTETYGKQYEGEQAPSQNDMIQRELRELGNRQEKIGRIANDIYKGKNKAN